SVFRPSTIFPSRTGYASTRTKCVPPRKTGRCCACVGGCCAACGACPETRHGGGSTKATKVVKITKTQQVFVFFVSFVIFVPRPSAVSVCIALHGRAEGPRYLMTKAILRCSDTSPAPAVSSIASSPRAYREIRRTGGQEATVVVRRTRIASWSPGLLISCE